jgi:hypothetical protein
MTAFKKVCDKYDRGRRFVLPTKQREEFTSASLAWNIAEAGVLNRMTTSRASFFLD